MRFKILLTPLFIPRFRLTILEASFVVVWVYNRVVVIIQINRECYDSIACWRMVRVVPLIDIVKVDIAFDRS